MHTGLHGGGNVTIQGARPQKKKRGRRDPGLGKKIDIYLRKTCMPYA